MSIKKYQFFLNTGQHQFDIPNVSLGNSIPKIIYQTYKNRSALKPEWIKNIQKICKLNPEWEYHFFDDNEVEEFIFLEYGEKFLKQYLAISPELGPARADLFRYLLIYKKGGVYLDIKTTLTKPLDSVLNVDDVYILSHWPNQLYQPKELIHLNYQEIIQWAILAAPGHPFLRNVINNVLGNLQVYNPWLHGVGKRGVLRITGPYAYTCAIESIRHKYSFRFTNITAELGIYYSLYELWDEFKSKADNENHMSVHGHYSRSKQLILSRKNISTFLYRILHNN